SPRLKYTPGSCGKFGTGSAMAAEAVLAGWPDFAASSIARMMFSPTELFLSVTSAGAETSNEVELSVIALMTVGSSRPALTICTTSSLESGFGLSAAAAERPKPNRDARNNTDTSERMETPFWRSYSHFCLNLRTG